MLKLTFYFSFFHMILSFYFLSLSFLQIISISIYLYHRIIKHIHLYLIRLNFAKKTIIITIFHGFFY